MLLFYVFAVALTSPSWKASEEIYVTKAMRPSRLIAKLVNPKTGGIVTRVQGKDGLIPAGVVLSADDEGRKILISGLTPESKKSLWEVIEMFDVAWLRYSVKIRITSSAEQEASENTLTVSSDTITTFIDERLDTTITFGGQALSDATLPVRFQFGVGDWTTRLDTKRKQVLTNSPNRTDGVQMSWSNDAPLSKGATRVELEFTAIAPAVKNGS